MFPKEIKKAPERRVCKRFIGDTLKFKMKVGSINDEFADLTSYDNIRIMAFTNKNRYVFTASIDNGIAIIDNTDRTLEFTIDSDSSFMFDPGLLRFRIEFFKDGELYSIESPAIIELENTIFADDGDDRRIARGPVYNPRRIEREVI